MRPRKILTDKVAKYLVLLVCLAMPAILCAQKEKEKTTTSTPPPKITAPAKGAVTPPKGPVNSTRTPGNGAPTTPNNKYRQPTGPGTSRNPIQPGGPKGPAAATTRPITPAKPVTTTRGGHIYTTKQMQIGGRPGEVRYRDGRIAHIHTQGMDIRRGLRNDRRIERFDGRGGRVMVAGRGRGFYERAYFNRGTHRYIQRTYVWGGRRYAYAYRTYYWNGRPYYRYAPAVYYRPAFYVWAYRPWPGPVAYAWGWGPAPWYGYYGYYFAPAPVYPTASLWVTDYVMAENLRLAYDAQVQDGEQPGPPQAANGSVLTPEVKQAIAQEVQEQLQAEQQAAAAPGGPSPTDSDNQAPPALSPTQKTFIVGAALDVTAADGTECHLSQGDVIYRTTDPSAGGTTVNVLVQGSQKGDCEMGSTAVVEVADLQELHNEFCEQVDAAIQKLAKEQGQAGLPAAPDTTTVAGEVPPPTPDNAAADQLQTAQNDADQTEKQAAQQGAPGGAN